MTSYKVNVYRGATLIHSSVKYASPNRERAKDVLLREARKMFGDDVWIELH